MLEYFYYSLLAIFVENHNIISKFVEILAATTCGMQFA